MPERTPRYDPRKLALAQEVSHRLTTLKETDAEICAAMNLEPVWLKKFLKSPVFREVHRYTLVKITDKMAEKTTAIQFGSLQEQMTIRRTNAWEAYQRVVEISQTAESEKLRFDANKWVAACGGITEFQETLPAHRPDLMDMDDKTKEFVVATIRETQKIKSASVRMELPERTDDAIDIRN